MLQNKPPFIIWLFSFLFLTHMIIYTFFFFNYRLLCCVWVCQTTHFSSHFDKPDILQLLHILFQLHFQIKRILKALRLQMASWWGVNSSFGLKPFWGSLFSGCSLQSPLMPSPGPHSHLAVSLILTSVPLWSSGREGLEHQHPSLPPSHPEVPGGKQGICLSNLISAHHTGGLRQGTAERAQISGVTTQTTTNP